MKGRSRSASDKGALAARRKPNSRTRLAVLACFGLIGLFGRDSWAAADPHPCQLKEYASLPLVVLMRGPPLVSVEINGRATRMELDLGSAVSLLYDGAVPRLGLKTRPLPYGVPKIDVAGKELTQYVAVPTFKLNQLELRGVQMLVQPADSIPPDVATTPAEAN